MVDRWDNSSLKQDHHRRNSTTTRHRRENPSFSSTLLDAIYRSIDDGEEEGEVIFYRETMRKKQSGSGGCLKEEEDGMVNFRRACLLEKWVEKKVSEKVVVRRSSPVDFVDRKSRQHLLNSSSTSSTESSSGGGFSSSESDSLPGSKSSFSCYSIQKPKPIRTSVSNQQPSEKPQHHHHYNSVPKQKSKHENSFVKTKSKALKIYGDLKKVKQPISPGGRLASFLNSIFTAGNTKKAKIEELGSQRKSKSTNGSTCSSASSFSRSCLSNTPSSRGKMSNSSAGTKRSVRFCPVSVIVDEDCRPCGQKNLIEDHKPQALMAENYYYAMDVLKNYQMKKNNHKETKNDVVEEFDMRDIVQNDNEESEIDDDDDDAASYSSSDLFELDNLSVIGIERYSEELPVYETTHFDTNRAIANGLIL
ncbi:hypothetical protein UlMin_011973 [Ulmus minor]